MGLSSEILSILSSRGASSIEYLRQRLGANSRDIEAAVSKLNQSAPFITRSESEIFTLNQVSDGLSSEKIRAQLGCSADRFILEVVSTTASTNDDLLSMIREGRAQDRLIRVAETQTSGRGTKGRPWISVPGGSLTFSILRSVTDTSLLKDISSLPLVVGLSLVRSINASADIDCRLKWPNDILFQRKKLGGILIESTSINRQCFVVIGVGINVCVPRALLEDINQPAIDLHSLGASIDRNILIGNMLIELDNLLDRYFVDGFDYFRKEWCAMHAYHNQMVSFALPDGRRLEGEVIDVDSNGALVLNINGKVRRYISGEIQLNK